MSLSSSRILLVTTLWRCWKDEMSDYVPMWVYNKHIVKCSENIRYHWYQPCWVMKWKVKWAVTLRQSLSPSSSVSGFLALSEREGCSQATTQHLLCTDFCPMHKQSKIKLTTYLPVTNHDPKFLIKISPVVKLCIISYFIPEINEKRGYQAAYLHE